MNWNKGFRGTDSVYGESIYTNRVELLGNYQLPTTEKFSLAFSLNHHHQNSMYGNTLYMAKQQVGFAQMVWDKTIGKHDFLLGTALRYTYYNDNTPATGSTDRAKMGTAPQRIILPGIFAQDEISFNRATQIISRTSLRL
jgi:outer membrane receptor for ferrienterochelin and colicins